MKLLRICLGTVLALLLLDVVVGAMLSAAQSQNRLSALVRYFDYGRSVPGKLTQWEATPGTYGNLYDIGWINDEAAPDTTEGPVVRAYGMSFVNRIMHHVLQAAPELTVDLHAGPSAPPNFTYALFEADRDNRRPGDVVVLGVLSSAVVGLGSLSNRSWVFEQPAAFTYPIYLPDGPAPGLRRIEPVLQSVEDQRNLPQTPELRAEWAAQLRTHDYNWDPAAFLLPELDVSPFARLVRRSLAISGQETRKAHVMENGYPVAEVLQRMVVQFAQTARADGQVPVVFVIQSRDPRDPDLQQILAPVLEAHDIDALITAELISPRDTFKYGPKGHFLPELDRQLAEMFLKMVDLPKSP